jgi:uncharacterized DUF497 family protein
MALDDIGDFAWDAAKSERCRRERGFSFAFAVPAFADPDRRVEIDDRRELWRDPLPALRPDRGALVRDRVHAARPDNMDHLGAQGERAGETATW